jgi:hypothetical protein
MFTQPCDPDPQRNPCLLSGRRAGEGEALSHFAKKKFTEEEDKHLQHLVIVCGIRDWKAIALCMNGRTARQCRERFKYYLELGLKRRAWTRDEDRLLMDKYKSIGPRWARIALSFHGRTDIDLKNRYHRIMRR